MGASRIQVGLGERGALISGIRESTHGSGGIPVGKGRLGRAKNCKAAEEDAETEDSGKEKAKNYEGVPTTVGHIKGSSTSVGRTQGMLRDVERDTWPSARAHPRVPRMRVLAVLERLASAGTEWQAVHVLRGLAERGHTVHLASLEPPPDGSDVRPLTSSLDAAGVTRHELGVSHRWHLAQGAQALGRLSRRHNIDIVHGRLYFAGLHAAASRVFAPKAKRVVSFHNVIYDYPNQRLTDHARKRIEATVVGWGADALAAVSSSAASSYSKHLGFSNIEVVPNSVPAADIDPVPSDRALTAARYGLDPSRSWILCPARFVFEKGHRHLVEAMGRLHAQGLDAQLLCVGRGPLEGELRAQVEALRLAEVVFVSDREVSRAEVLELMGAADIVALPSLFEGFPNAAAEAMAKAKPLLGTSIGGLQDLVEHGQSGWLVPPADVAALAAGLEALLEDHDLRLRLGQAGRARVEREFSLERVVTAWESLYRRTLGDSYRA